MIVLDASSLVAVLLNTDVGRRMANVISSPAESLHAPQLLDIEVLQVLRGHVRRGAMTAERGAMAAEVLGQLDITRYGHDELSSRIWALRENLTAYDATYVALAEALDAPLLTLDARLAAAPGHQAKVRFVQ
ncbi:MAG: type II toxin-antitoxin system VapC family toxin [Dehalococcoidia bacterium]|nr:MAG: type II toxin-antitoxin system VapC family toxin [Dehalococcoidia bacterium]